MSRLEPVVSFCGRQGIACEHAIASSVEQTNWQRIVDLYDALVGLVPGPVVALNRAIATAELR
jgi:RNA polymerase sigma-70 factor, ECF subfamily